MYESFKQIFGSEQNIISKATNQKYKHKAQNENVVYKDTRYYNSKIWVGPELGYQVETFYLHSRWAMGTISVSSYLPRK